MIIEAISVVLLLTNLVTIAALVKAKKKKPQEKTLTKDATELLGELTKGGAIVVTSVVDPASLFQWSPKS